MVSIIITTRNEERNIKRILRSIKNQSYKNFEIILVDNNSSDKTKDIARKYTNKIFNIGPERSTQRNYGVDKAKGEYVLILDADMELHKDILKSCIEKIRKDKNIQGLIIPEKSVGTGFWSKVKAYERSFYLGYNDIEAARFFNKAIFKKFGGYDFNLTGPEDWDLPQRISKKYKIDRIDKFITHYEGSHTLVGLVRKKYYYALSSDRYLRKQNKPIIGPTTIYFLRPAFYKKWNRLLAHPVLSLGLIVMFIFELSGGGLGYLVGKYRK